MHKRYLAVFTPQALVGNQTIDIDPLGPAHWDVTQAMEGFDADTRHQILDRVSDIGDALVNQPNAPVWARAWPLPYYVVVTEHDAGDAERILASQAPTSSADTGATVESSIPDAQGRFARGYRAALQAMRTCLHEVLTGAVVDAAMSRAVQQLEQARREEDQRGEVQETLWASTAHLPQGERNDLAENAPPADLILTAQGEFGFLLLVPDAEDPLPTPAEGASEGLCGALAMARRMGASHVMFDCDGPLHADIPTHDE